MFFCGTGILPVPDGLKATAHKKLDVLWNRPKSLFFRG